MNFTLRAATGGDRAWLWATKRRCLRPYVEQTWGTWDDTSQQAGFDGKFDPAEIQVIAVDGRDAGYLSVARGKQEFQLFNLMINPEFQNQGLGATVLRGLLAEARSLGIPVRLQVLRVNPARRLYERLGFAVTEVTPTHFRMRWQP
jgi:ribosomal protein S18 acetylase RimI-like enzyme